MTLSVDVEVHFGAALSWLRGRVEVFDVRESELGCGFPNTGVIIRVQTRKTDDGGLLRRVAPVIILVRSIEPFSCEVIAVRPQEY